MMWYVIIGTDRKESGEARVAARPAHLARVKELMADGRLLLAGPFPAIDAPDPGPAGYSGSLMVVEFSSLEDAREWALQDPYWLEGVFEKVDVKPFKRVLPQ